MATRTTVLTSRPQYRRRHVTSSGRVYYTDRSPSYSKRDTIVKRADPNAHKKEKKHWIPSKQQKWEFKNYGAQYVQQKYKLSSSQMSAVRGVSSKIRAGAESDSGGKLVKVRMGKVYAMRKMGNSQLNAPPEARDGYVARAGRFRDGGPADILPAPDNSFKKRFALNLENDDELAQGSHHPWAQPTSISSLITSQLRQGQNTASDYWDVWAQDKGIDLKQTQRDSSPFGLDVEIGFNDVGEMDMDQQVSTTGPMTTLAEQNPMGAFGTSAVMDPYYGDEEHDDSHDDDAAYAAASSAVYNPWSEGEGGAYNSYGPNAQTMAQSTMEAMALANAYFAPQRMELAYQLGDMETDMRRLAVNLGRQVDDPVLQAKLYKEGMKAVRTMDIQQNTLAFQMAEQRRREELQNFQFYDSLAQQEYNLRLQNQQFMQKMELDNAYFGLKKDEVDFLRSQATPPTPNTSPVPGTENTPVGQQTQPAAPTIPNQIAPMPLPVNTQGTGGGNLL